MIQRCQNRCHMELVEKVTFAQLIVYQHSIQKRPLCVSSGGGGGVCTSGGVVCSGGPGG